MQVPKCTEDTQTSMGLEKQCQIIIGCPHPLSHLHPCSILCVLLMNEEIQFQSKAKLNLMWQPSHHLLIMSESSLECVLTCYWLYKHSASILERWRETQCAGIRRLDIKKIFFMQNFYGRVLIARIVFLGGCKHQCSLFVSSTDTYPELVLFCKV